jgi:multimeric flavodoxin WrbA
MKVVAFDGSSRKEGTIAVLLRRLLAELEAEGIETELVYLEKNPLTGCCGCGQCAHKLDDRCARPPDDGLNRCVQKMIAADGIIIGTPTYSAGCSPATQRLIQRMDGRRRSDGKPLARKVAAAVIGAGDVGATRAFDSIDHWFKANDMIVVGSSDGDLGAGAGEVERDEVVLERMAALGRTVAGALKAGGA